MLMLMRASYLYYSLRTFLKNAHVNFYLYVFIKKMCSLITKSLNKQHLGAKTN